MPLLSFTLSDEGVGVFHDALACLHKFSESLALEARPDKLILTALNSTKSAYACFTFAPGRFFTKYHFDAESQPREIFYCGMAIHSLLPIFQSRTSTSLTGPLDRDSHLAHAVISIEDSLGPHSRLIAKLVRRNGITSTHRLPFERCQPVHAKFDTQAAVNHWTAPARNLRGLLEYFGPGTELLDIYLEGDEDDDRDADEEGVVTFTCFTEKTVSGDQVLKKPLHTSIVVATSEFPSLSMPARLHTIITVKDFRSVVQHAALLNSDVTARFSTPAKPLQLSYVGGDGMVCEFLLMTVGDSGSGAAGGGGGGTTGAAARGRQRGAKKTTAGRRRMDGGGSSNSVRPPAPSTSTSASAHPSAAPSPYPHNRIPNHGHYDDGPYNFPDEEDEATGADMTIPRTSLPTASAQAAQQQRQRQQEHRQQSHLPSSRVPSTTVVAGSSDWHRASGRNPLSFTGTRRTAPSGSRFGNAGNGNGIVRGSGIGGAGDGNGSGYGTPNTTAGARAQGGDSGDSLFVTQDEVSAAQEEARANRFWAPVGDEEGDDGMGGEMDMVGWGRKGVDISSPLYMDIQTVKHITNDKNIPNPNDDIGADQASGIEPTQRLSDVQKFGLFNA